MDQSKGCLYARTHEAYDVHNACKMGIASNIPDRDSTYATGEIMRGVFKLVIEIPKDKMRIIEKLLQTYFNTLGFHIKFNGGTEFYKLDIITQIVPYLEKTNINFRVLSKQEIDDLTRCTRIRKMVIKEKLKILIQNLRIKRMRKQQIKYIPRSDQTQIMNDSVEYFQTQDKGMLILMCGVGKTLISLWITQQLHANTIVVGVPNTLLLEQWNKVIGELFPEIPVLVVSGGVSETDIQQFLKKYEERCIVITTYASSHKVNSVAQRIKIKFAMKILDEAHHLTSHNMKLSTEKKTYIHMLHIPASKQLALTATLKQLESMGDDDNVVSNDNVAQFGEIIDRKCLLWAIENNIVCDYVIQTITTNEDQLQEPLDQFNITYENDKRLFLSAYAALKSINEGHSHHLLIYSNNKDNSLKLNQFVKLLLENNYFELPDLYYSHYHSDINEKEQDIIINNFDRAKHGIITCVYCLGEGWDFPLLDAVVFAENMSSNIRIVQSALRASRKNKKEPNKKTKIILPVLNLDCDDSTEKTDFKKVSQVIYQMGLEDETITQKIKVCRIEIKKQKPRRKDDPEDKHLEDFGEYDEELTQKLRLKTTKRTALGMTYEKVRKILVEKNIKSKEAYLELCKRDNRLTPDPDLAFKSQFTTWIEFLSIPRGFYYELDTCKRKVAEYVALHTSIRNNYLDLAVVCCELCKVDSKFPPNGLWVDYYNVKDLRDIITIAPKKKNKYDILDKM